MSTLFVRKDRVIDGSRRHGPTHIEQPNGLTLCGRRMRGILHSTRNRPDESLLCDLCLAHDRRGTRKAWKA